MITTEKVYSTLALNLKHAREREEEIEKQYSKQLVTKRDYEVFKAKFEAEKQAYSHALHVYNLSQTEETRKANEQYAKEVYKKWKLS